MTKDAETAVQSVVELITTYALDVEGALVLLIVGWVGRITRRAIDATPRSPARWSRSGC